MAASPALLLDRIDIHYHELIYERTREPSYVIRGRVTQLVTFHLGQEIYGIDIFKIQEVIHLQKISAIPNSPKFVKGVIEVRNQVIPVINLKKRLGIREDGEDKQRIVILDLDGQLLGVPCQKLHLTKK